ncbi:pyridoxamine 5'-phosphate oxidase family protein [Dactylosporangium sp. NPDC051541]|uniref:pyridoxamine 5'-phosphate oxidase family protein n=1 Tax=Dactylosporangium sp. NPDC051541 TaxID=3363977 RepID=UPI0037AE40DF
MPDSGVFHWGELAAQTRAGYTERAAAVSRLVRPVLPNGAEDFLAEQRLLVVGAQGEDGRLWASLFAGPRGFVSALDDESVLVRARLAADDPAEPMTRRPGRLGLLAIDLQTRIRLRVNGTSTPLPGGLLLAVEQSFPNCPKYIQRRSAAEPDDAGAGEPGPGAGAAVSALTGTMRELVAHADTFFVASASAAGDPDVSHRGGNPGFVEVLSPTRLRWPDYVGNSMLMTLGNMIENPRAGLTFVDWASGSTLQLTGRAEVRWPEGAGAATSGPRLVEFEVEAAVHRPGALALRWSPPSLSRFNPPLAA